MSRLTLPGMASGLGVVAAMGSRLLAFAPLILLTFGCGRTTSPPSNPSQSVAEAPRFEEPGITPALLKELTITPELLKELYVTPVAPKRDPGTGFVVGGKNATELILGLKEINGLKIADIEKDMRPPPTEHKGLSSEEIKEYSFGFRSRSGFLSATEKLLEVMAEDNRDVVESLGLTHQALARPLLVLPALAVKQSWDSAEVSYRGSRFVVSVVAYKGFQLSPFRDGTQTNIDVTVKNLGNGKSISYSLLVPQMIDRYGFYEGKGREYRVEPHQVLEVFPFLKPSAQR